MEKVFEVKLQEAPWTTRLGIFPVHNFWAMLRMLTVRAGYGPLLREYVYFLLAKLAFHRQHPEFNGKSCAQIFNATTLIGGRSFRV